MNRPVRIGIIDSGVHSAHPHIGNVAGGVTIGPDALEMSYADRLGHGTAIAALIHSRAPRAELFAVKIFQHALTANLRIVLSAIDWCLQNEIDLINLSLGTPNTSYKTAFEAALARVGAAGKGIVSAFEVNGVPALPGCLPGVVGVLADSSKAPGEHGVGTRGAKKIFTASPFPRDIPGVPRECNLQGVSFAVAHVTATLASLWTASTAAVDWESLLAHSIGTMANV
jgi:subtilisin family serine protease